MSLKDRLRMYVVTDRRLHKEIETVKLALEGGATAIQLRIKESSTREMIKIGKDIRKLTLDYDALFFVNDRVDVALAVNADGVHLGQKDIPPYMAREIAPNLILGVSASSIEEAVKAEREGAHYLGAGSVFPTKTKKDVKNIGLSGLRSIVNEVNIPVVAIGGINYNNLISVLECGVTGVAMISAIVGAPDIKIATLKIRAVIDTFMEIKPSKLSRDIKNKDKKIY